MLKNKLQNKMANQEIDKGKIEDVITSLLSGIDKKNAELYADILEKNKRSLIYYH